MKLSIITVNLNNHFGLKTTIESVIAQTFQDFEHIIIDGGSTDGSNLIIEKFSDKGIIWISEEDSGVFNAMNKGIRIAQGEYLLFLNSGDYLVNFNVLENVFSLNYAADILCGKCQVSNKKLIVHTTNPPEEFSLSYFYKSTLAHQATFIRRSLFNSYGYYYENFRLVSDRAFWIKTLILGNVTVERIDLIISDYNLDGMSSDIRNRSLMKQELSESFSRLGLDKIIIDYDGWELERKELEPLVWIKTKWYLYKPLLSLFQLVKKIKTKNGDGI